MNNIILRVVVLCYLALAPLCLSSASADHDDEWSGTSIVFATLGRSDYAFDIYTLPLSVPPEKSNEARLTDSTSVNFNGHFPSSTPSSVLLLLPDQNSTQDLTPYQTIQLVYITERNGSSSIYYDQLYYDGLRSSIVDDIHDRVQVRLIPNQLGGDRVSIRDRPSIVGESVVYVSTHENSGVPRTSWAAVYSTELTTGLTRRLTPPGVSDFSPSVSPSGKWTAVASYGIGRSWSGEVEELETDIYVFSTADGSSRVKVVDHGGWPSWADESTLYFHRRSDDGWWSVYRVVSLLRPNWSDSVVVKRITPPGLHAFTPAASPGGNNSFIAIATRRPDSEFRHIELYNVVTNEFIELTRLISPNIHHFNPFISPDSGRVGYHKCRGETNGSSKKLLLENLKSPLPDISLFRIDGSFPSFSPDGSRIAYVKFPGAYVVNWDGSGRRQILSRTAFSTAWDPVRKGIVYTSVGPTFAAESTKVDVISIDVDAGDDDEQVNYKMLTTGGENNAFPSPSPDGKWIVFRSGRSGHKNLYIMDAVDGERGGIYRLTEGPWSDTMCNWSPDGDWIAFASDRDNPGGGGFAMYMIHPNGTGLRKVVHSGSGGRTNHPWFSPDGKHMVFTSDYAAVSAEPISNPHHYQPYGDIFTIKLDGSGIRRLTHNSYEDGTPTWGPNFIKPVDVEWTRESSCSFDDCHWLSGRPTFTIQDANLGCKAQCG